LRGYGVRLTCPHGVGWLTNHMDPMGVNSQYAFRHAPFSQIVSQPRSCLLPSFVRLSYFQFSDRVTKFTPTSSHANVAVILCVICDGHACVIVNSQPTGVPSRWSFLVVLVLFLQFCSDCSCAVWVSWPAVRGRRETIVVCVRYFNVR